MDPFDDDLDDLYYASGRAASVDPVLVPVAHSDNESSDAGSEPNGLDGLDELGRLGEPVESGTQDGRKRRRLEREVSIALTSISSSSRPPSYTAINAFLHYARGRQVNRRTVAGLVWPEHPSDFVHSRLMCETVAAEPMRLETTTRTQPIPFNPITAIPRASHALPRVKSTRTVGKLGPSVRLRISPCALLPEDLDDADADQIAVMEQHETLGEEQGEALSAMSESVELHDALEAMTRSIWHERRRERKTPAPATEIDPILARILARHCAAFIETVFDEVVLTRMRALVLLRRMSETGRHMENVPSNWQSVREAANSLAGRTEMGDAVLSCMDRVALAAMDERLQRLFASKTPAPRSRPVINLLHQKHKPRQS